MDQLTSNSGDIFVGLAQLTMALAWWTCSILRVDNEQWDGTNWTEVADLPYKETKK